jgi:hypothetical protein
MVTQQKYIFEALWSRSRPATERIAELEGTVKDGADVPRTGIIIDRVYSCSTCGVLSVFEDEVKKHRETTGHNEFHEYRI